MRSRSARAGSAGSRTTCCSTSAFSWKINLTGEADGGRDLGLLDNGSNQEAFLDTTPWAHFQFSPQWSAFVRARLFVPTGEVLPNGNDNNNVGATDKAFVGLKEA